MSPEGSFQSGAAGEAGHSLEESVGHRPPGCMVPLQAAVASEGSSLRDKGVWEGCV